MYKLNIPIETFLVYCRFLSERKSCRFFWKESHESRKNSAVTAGSRIGGNIHHESYGFRGEQDPLDAERYLAVKKNQ